MGEVKSVLTNEQTVMDAKYTEIQSKCFHFIFYLNR